MVVIIIHRLKNSMTNVEVFVRYLSISIFTTGKVSVLNKIHRTAVVNIHRMKNSKSFVEVFVRT